MSQQSQEPHENAETQRKRVATKHNLKRSKRSDDSTEQRILEILSEKMTLMRIFS
jgi:hypothetical protein